MKVWEWKNKERELGNCIYGEKTQVFNNYQQRELLLMLTPFQCFNNGQPVMIPLVLNFQGLYLPVIQNDCATNKVFTFDSPGRATQLSQEAIKKQEGVGFSPSESSAFKTTKGSAETKPFIGTSKNKCSTSRKPKKTKKIQQFDSEQENMGSSLSEFSKSEDHDDSKSGRIGWTKEEEHKLIQLVDLFGKHWKHISEHLPNRNPKQIRERYLNYLRADISTEKWTPEQDSRLLKLVEQHGHRWKYIEKKMKKRSQNQLKNRYYGHFKKQMRARKTQLDLPHPQLKKSHIQSQVPQTVNVTSVNRQDCCQSPINS